MDAQVPRIIAGTIDKGRLAPSQERHAHDVHAGGLDDHAVMADVPLVVEQRDF